MTEQLEKELGALSWRARVDAWRMRRRAARQTRPARAGTAALAAVGRLSGVQTAGRRVAVAVAVLGAVVGALVALVLLRPRAVAG